MLSHKKGFTLLELIVVLGILAVLAAVAIPTIIGVINKSKETADNKQASQMTAAIEQWTSEYTIYAQDYYSNVSLTTTTHARVKDAIKNLGYSNLETSGLAEFERTFIDKGTKYPKGQSNNIIKIRVIGILNVYMKNFDEDNLKPRQNEFSFWYLSNTSTIICAPTTSTQEELNSKASAFPSNGSIWINLSDDTLSNTKLSVTVTQIGNGGAILGSGTDFNMGDTVTLKTSDGEEAFQGWFDKNNNLLSTDPTYSFVILENVEIIAKYGSLIEITTGTKGDGGGYVEGGGLYKVNGSVTLTAHPNQYNSFTGWYIDSSKVSDDISYTFTATQSVKVIAEFKIKKYTLNLKGDNGTCSGGGTFASGMNVTASFVPHDDYNFVNWINIDTNEVVSLSPSYSFTIKANTNLQATTKKKEFLVKGSVKYLVNGVEDSTIKNLASITGVGTYDINSNVTISTEPLSGHCTFLYWENTKTKEKIYNSVYSFTLNENTELIAYYEYSENQVEEGGTYIKINKTYTGASVPYTYEKATTITAGSAMPQNPSPGDIYKIGQYTYVYKASNIYTSYQNSNYDGHFIYSNEDGWLLTTIDNQKLEVYDSEILSKINGKPVISAEYCWSNSLTTKQIKGIIPSTVKSIKGAFSGCASLIEPPELSEGLISMEEAFINCLSLKYPPATPTTVKNLEKAYYYCTSLANAPLIFAENMRYAFYNCYSLTTLPPITTKDMDYAFYGCYGLKHIPILSGVESMNYTFQGCTNAEFMTNIPSSVKYMDLAFEGCNKLKGLVEYKDSTALISYIDTFYHTDSENQLIIYNYEKGNLLDNFEEFKSYVYKDNIILINKKLEYNTPYSLQYNKDAFENDFVYLMFKPTREGIHTFTIQGSETSLEKQFIGILYNNKNSYFNIEEFNMKLSDYPEMSNNNLTSSTELGILYAGKTDANGTLSFTVNLDADGIYILKLANYYHNFNNTSQITGETPVSNYNSISPKFTVEIN